MFNQKLMASAVIGGKPGGMTATLGLLCLLLDPWLRIRTETQGQNPKAE